MFGEGGANLHTFFSYSYRLLSVYSSEGAPIATE
jgi:hypothetical protein